MKHVALSSLCFFCFVAVATAQNNHDNHVFNTTGNVLREKCRYALKDIPYTVGPQDAIDLGYCVGFLDATVAVEKFWKMSDDKGQEHRVAHFCLPEEITSRQVALIVENWMKEHPEKLHLSGAGIIREALIKAFPCE